jgi:hypothetical protein
MATRLLEISKDGALAGIRSKRTDGDNNDDVYAVYDFITKKCDYKDDNSTARKAFERLIAEGSEHRYKVMALISYHKFPGRGQRNTPCMTLQGLQVLTTCLGDKVRKAYIEETSSIVQRYLDGDCAMISEIEQNQRLGRVKSYENFVNKVTQRANAYAIARSGAMPRVSYVYATKTPAFPGLLKIGKTVDLGARLSGLNTSCAPLPHEFVAIATTFDHDRDEKAFQAFFSSARREGEFFELEELDVIAYFDSHITGRFNAELAVHMGEAPPAQQPARHEPTPTSSARPKPKRKRAAMQQQREPIPDWYLL